MASPRTSASEPAEQGRPAGFFSSHAYRGHEALHLFSDEASGLRAFIAIHSTAPGPALGGIRLRPYRTEAEAVDDALRLSSAMTRKAIIAGVPYGGGKTTVIADPTQKTPALLWSLGRAIESLGGRYVAAEDVGIWQEDVDRISEETRHVAGRSRARGGRGDPGAFTAAGVLAGMHACAAAVFGMASLRNKTILVQGVGQVGAPLARLLHGEGARLLVTDTRDARVRAIEDDLGAKRVPPESVIETECDILAPCALGGALNHQSIPRLRCRIIAGSANNQLAESEDAERLRRAGILYAPDYVINAGGLIHIVGEIENAEPPETIRRIAEIEERMQGLIEESHREDVSPALIADRLVEERLSSFRKRPPGSGPVSAETP